MALHQTYPIVPLECAVTTAGQTAPKVTAMPTPPHAPKTEVPVLSVAPAGDHSVLHRAKAFPFVSEGSVYAFALREYLVEPSILPGESAVAALCATAAGLTYGLTCGQRSHLFYFHPGFGVCDVGIVSDKPVSGGALLRLADGNVLGGFWGPEGGGLFRHDGAVEMGQGMEQFRGLKSGVESLPLPEPGEGIAALAGPDYDGFVFALTLPGGLLLRIDPATGAAETVARIEQAAPVLVNTMHGPLLGAHAEGRLWQYSSASGELTALEAFAPCQQGKRYAAGVASLLLAGDGLIYGGTSTDGFLFTYDWFSGTVTNLGKPGRQSHVRALVEGHDGHIYGLVEEPQGLAHLFRWDRSTRSFTDLGVLNAAFPESWIAHSLGSMCVGRGGELFIGETDSLSHLFIYYPPIGPRGCRDGKGCDA